MQQEASRERFSSHSKQFHLKGKVVSIDDRAKMVNVDSEAIPDFMDAMTMPYKVKPESELDKLHPGDAITADLLVQDEGAWIENINSTGHPVSAGAINSKPCEATSLAIACGKAHLSPP